MALKHTSKVSIERIDSDFLHGLFASAHNSNEAAKALLTSSPPSSSKYAFLLYRSPHISSPTRREFRLRTFDDTEWDDVGRSDWHNARLDRLSRQIAARVKTPTHFPIKPLPETLERAREEARKEAARKSSGSFVNRVQVPTGPRRITIINHGTGKRGLRPARIVLLNRDRLHEPESKPVRLVLINRRPETVVDDTITSNSTKSLLVGASHGYGRTRAATMKLRELGLEAEKIGRKRKAEGTAEGERQHKTSKLDKSE